MASMNRIERDVWRVIFQQLLRQPLTALNNARFMLAMRLGGFAGAWRNDRRVR